MSCTLLQTCGGLSISLMLGNVCSKTGDQWSPLHGSATTLVPTHVILKNEMTKDPAQLAAAAPQNPSLHSG